MKILKMGDAINIQTLGGANNHLAMLTHQKFCWHICLSGYSESKGAQMCSILKIQRRSREKLQMAGVGDQEHRLESHGYFQKGLLKRLLSLQSNRLFCTALSILLVHDCYVFPSLQIINQSETFTRTSF